MSSEDLPTVERELLRHLLATIAYRASQSLVEAPGSLAEARASNTHRTAIEIVGHMADVLAWALSNARGAEEWVTLEGTWTEQVERFYCVLEELDAHLKEKPVSCSPCRLIQGPLADTLTHVGQLASLRRSCGSPVPPQNYFLAEIRVGEIRPTSL